MILPEATIQSMDPSACCVLYDGYVAIANSGSILLLMVETLHDLMYKHPRNYGSVVYGVMQLHCILLA